MARIWMLRRISVRRMRESLSIAFVPVITCRKNSRSAGVSRPRAPIPSAPIIGNTSEPSIAFRSCESDTRLPAFSEARNCERSRSMLVSVSAPMPVIGCPLLRSASVASIFGSASAAFVAVVASSRRSSAPPLPKVLAPAIRPCRSGLSEARTTGAPLGPTAGVSPPVRWSKRYTPSGVASGEK